jgi:hypothetical protein
MSLNYKQKLALKYFQASSATKAALDKIYYFAGSHADGYETRGHDGSDIVFANAMNVDYDVSRLGSKSGYTVIFPLITRYAHAYEGLHIISKINSAGVRGFLAYSSLNIDQLVYRFSYRNTSDVWAERAIVTPFTPSIFGCFVFSLDMTSGTARFWDNYNKTAIEDTYATSTFKDFEGQYSTNYYQFETFGYNQNNIYRSFAGIMPAFCLIEEFITTDEIALIANHFTEIYKPRATQTSNPKYGLTNATFEFLPIYGQGSMNVSNQCEAIYSNASVEPEHSIFKLPIVTSANNTLFMQKGWGVHKPMVIEDWNQEEVAVNAKYTGYRTGTLSKVAGSPSGSGSQVLRYVTTISSSFAGVRLDVNAVNGATQIGNGTVAGYSCARLRGWVRGQAASGVALVFQSPNESNPPETVPGDGNWHYIDRIIDNLSSYFLIVLRGSTVSGDWIEFDDLKVDVIYGDQHALAFVGDAATYQSSLNNTYAMQQIIDSSDQYTFAFAFDTTNTDYTSSGLRLFSDSFTGTNTRILDLYTNGTANSLTLHSKPYDAFNDTITTDFECTSGKHSLIVQRNGTTISFYLDGVLITTRDSSTNTVAITAARIGSYYNTTNFCRFIFGGFWGWKDGTISISNLQNYIEQMLPME